MNHHQVTHADLESVGGPAMAVQDAGDNHHGEVVDADFRFEGDCLPGTKPAEAVIVVEPEGLLTDAEEKANAGGKTIMLMDVDGETK